MKVKKQKPDLTPVQSEAISEARNGKPYLLMRLIKSLEKTMIRLQGPINDDPLGRWTLGMREHYGYLLGMLKTVLKETTPKSRKKYVKNI